MKIHTDTLTVSDVHTAARVARVDLELSEHGSRSRDHAFAVHLQGESRRRPNRQVDSGYAATWDQWGVFLSVLFDLDGAGHTFGPSAPMFAGDAGSPVYADRDDFHRKTGDRFVPGGIVTADTVDAFPVHGNPHDGTDPFMTVYRVAGSYWPADAHGDHKFNFEGVMFEQSCSKCSAVTRWA